MAVTEILYAVEQRETAVELRHQEWELLPNAIHTAECHAEFDMSELVKDFPRDEYRLATYTRTGYTKLPNSKEWA